MAVAEEQLRLLITAEVQNAIKGLKDVQDGLGETGKKAGGIKEIFETLGVAISAAAFVGGIKAMVSEFTQAEDAGARLDGMIKATGGSAGMSAEAVKSLAQEIQKTTAFEADSVVEAQAMLMSFKNISGENFKETTRQALNLASALKMDAQSAVMLLGKALDNPTEGIAALKRAKVSLSEASQEQIAKLMEENKLHEAQAVILREVEARFGGMAEAMAQTTSGQIAQMQNALGDLAESVGEAMAPVITTVAGSIKGLAEGLGSIPAPIALGVTALGGFLTIGPLVVKAIEGMKSAMVGFGAVITGPAGIVAGLASLAVMGISAINDVAKKGKEEYEAMLKKKKEAETAELEASIDSSIARFGVVIEKEQKALSGFKTDLEKYNFLIKEITKLEAEGQKEFLNSVSVGKKDFKSNFAEGDINISAETEKKSQKLGALKVLAERFRTSATAQAKGNMADAAKQWWDTYNKLIDEGVSEYEKKVRKIEQISTMIDQALAWKNGADVDGLRGALQRAEADLAAFNQKAFLASDSFSATWLKAGEVITEEKKRIEDLGKAEQALRIAKETGNQDAIVQAEKTLELLGAQKAAVDELRESFVGSFQGMFGEIGAGFAALFSMGLDDKILKDFKDKSDAFFIEWSSGLRSAFSAAGSLAQEVFQSMSDEETRTLEKSIKATEEKISSFKENYDSQLEFMKANGMDTVDFERRMKVEEKAMEEELARKKAELKKKQFEQEKLAKLGSIAMNTAQGIAGAFVGATPFTIALHAGLAAFIGGMGAAQAAIVAGQQIPEFYNGGILSGSAGGTLLRAGERNQPEAIIPLRKEKLRELGMGASGGISVVVNGVDKSPREVALEVAGEMEKLRREGVI